MEHCANASFFYFLLNLFRQCHLHRAYVATVYNQNFIAVYSSLGCEFPQYFDDAWCDDGNNNAECEFDGGDCCTASAAAGQSSCTVCECIGGEGYEGNLFIYLFICLLVEGDFKRYFHISCSGF